MMLTTTIHTRILALLCAVVGVALLSSSAMARLSDDEFDRILEDEIATDADISDLNKEIEEKADDVRSLEERLKVYEDNIEQKQNEQLTLESQLSVIESTIEETRVEIEKKDLELEVLQLEIEALQEQIHSAETELEKQMGDLANVIRTLYIAEQRTSLEITFSNDTFSTFFADLDYTNRLQEDMKTSVRRLEHTAAVLDDKKVEMKDKKAESSLQKTNLELQKDDLQGEELYKEQLLEETQESEEEFQGLLQEVQDEQATIEGSIAALERGVQSRISNIREEIQKRLDDQSTTTDDLTEEEQSIINGPVSFDWPIDSRLITCSFKCPDYPFRRYFEHTAIDISTPMGSEVRAAAGGYVTIAKSDGTSSYAYIMIVHGDGYSTVYGHVSAVNVAVDDYVKQGEVIGYSGGMPGTPGAGSYSTGPHLHFEVRLNGIPVDPTLYLP